MNLKINLYRKNWFTTESVSTIGWAAYQGKNYSGEAFNHMILSQIKGEDIDFNTFHKLCRDLNGNFAIIITNKDRILLATDHIRSYPLLYYTVNGITYITDNLLAAVKDNNLQPEIEVGKAEMFLLSGMALEDSTIYRDIYGIQAAEIVQLSGKDIRKERYFIYSLNTDGQKYLSVNEEIEKQNKILARVFQRVLDSAPNVRNWILPLSGGHDSRTVINQMHRLGVKNIICYTYGKKENTQSRISKEIAGKLGYPWHFIEYTPAKWETFRKSGDFDNYFDFAFNGISDPHIQDLLAVSVLKAQGIIQEGDIFMPGHTYDFLTGAYCIDGIDTLQSERDLYNYLSMYFNQWEYQARSKNIFTQFSDMVKRAPVPKPIFSEYFHWQERHAKFIQNSVRVYEYFGFDWRTPLWDREVAEYWQTIPLKYKKYRNFLYLCEKNGLYTEPLASIPFDIEIRPAKGFKEKLMTAVPYAWKRKLKYHIRKETPQSDDALYTVYAGGSPLFRDIMPYDNLPNQLRYYLKPYRNRPLFWFPDNDNNSLYALRNM